jgi:hypothetical protein
VSGYGYYSGQVFTFVKLLPISFNELITATLKRISVR